MIQANDEQAVIRQLQTMLRSIQIARGDVVTVPVDGTIRRPAMRLNKSSMKTGLP